MKKTITLVAVISLVIFILLSGGGCKGEATEESIETAIEEAIGDEGGDAEVDISEGETTITTDEGEMTIGEGTELPDGFPDVIPLYANMVITTSWKTTENDLDAFSVAASSNDPGGTIFDWYMNQLGAWQNVSEFASESDGQTLSSISADNGTYTLIVTIVDSEEGTIVTISVSEMSSGTTSGSTGTAVE